MKTIHAAHLLLALGLAPALGTAAQAEPSVVRSVVAHRGQEAPGTPSGTAFDLFDDAWLNASGDVAFRAQVASPEGYPRGLWRRDGAGLSAIALEGDPAPGVAPAGLFRSLGAPLSLTAAGGVGFLGSLERGTGDVTYDNDRGLWGPAPDASLALLVHEGDAAPGVSGLFAGSLNRSRIRDGGVVFTDSLEVSNRLRSL